ncbi:MAG: antibiotic biosynthesis monooxygenase [Bradyrhizobium sp.]|nr:antibiotic biosynthesis monooxygenase [Bradyrhizobium sp.]
MHYVLIIHAVENYSALKQVFDRAATMRKHAGEESYHVLRDERDANKIVHFSKWNSLTDARAFFESKELIEIRRGAGVHAPEFIYLNSLAQGTL